MAKWLKATSIESEHINYDLFIKIDEIIYICGNRKEVGSGSVIRVKNDSDIITSLISVKQSLGELIDQIEGKE